MKADVNRGRKISYYRNLTLLMPQRKFLPWVPEADRYLPPQKTIFPVEFMQKNCTIDKMSSNLAMKKKINFFFRFASVIVQYPKIS